MSLNSWKSEFYPTPATDIAKTGTEKDIVSHSLVKWQGRSPENLVKHGVTQLGKWIVYETDSTEAFLIDEETCSLCKAADDMCESCIFTSRIGKTCYQEYFIFRQTGNVQPMIDTLSKLLKIVS